MTIHAYLCGCSLSVPRREDEIGWICAEHGMRPYGWRSPSKGKPGGGDALDYAEWARITRLGRSEGATTTTSDVQDIRDKRDAEAIGREILARSNAKSRNVHTKDSIEFLKKHPVEGWSDD
jgi:hypothetical protein